MTAKKEEQTTLETLGMEEEEVLMSQEALIEGLLAAADYENDENIIKNIPVRRGGGPVLFQFKVHPLSEPVLIKIKEQSTRKTRNPKGKHLPPIEELKIDEFRSRKIYAATCDEDKAKLWDNPQVRAKLTANAKNGFIGESWEIIDIVLLAGEKAKISDIIDDISGYNDDEDDVTEYAKN